MPESIARKVPPSWLGFHRDGLITVLILDCLWMFIEVSAAASIVGIPAIPFIAFVLFGLTSYIVFSKQRILGNSYVEASWISLFLGVIAGVPIPVFFTIGFMVIGIVNKILPKTKGIEVKLPTLDQQNMGKFISDFKVVEELLKLAVQEVDASQVSSKVSENIKFLQDRGMIPADLVKSLDKIRGTRNNVTHSTTEMPSVSDLRELKKVKDEVETIFKR
ncbi:MULTISPECIES: hypothetical protein [unclassified Coleofasciculus]|uniref:hypothetical protein n=1 Tax=unclassified Coleofasciculus TaxID=2692782 RepID=UPI0018815D79|nr:MULTISPECIES: hypothetical protein [unclassified Coleofasciculus]MBE9126315.1 hypothetical protein [Coleofasciculus sp. LEGE 07081]MBE9147508.1 hypothetical protein [Coleofasciculus sp. LEGE 07092]